MRYQGGKSRLVKYILPHFPPTDLYIEPFVGSASVLQHVLARKRIGVDNNKYIIALLAAIRDGWIPPEEISEEEYRTKSGPDYLVGFMGFGCSWGGKFFGGYARGESRNYATEARTALLKQAPRLQDTAFICGDYACLKPSGAVIYCDPPYQNTTDYTGPFDHDRLHKILRRWAQDNIVLLSEQAMLPYKLLWEQPYSGGIRKTSGKPTEKLYRIEK